jgi:hypothetical protein
MLTTYRHNRSMSRFPALDALLRDAETAAADQTDPLAVVLMHMLIRSEVDPYRLNGVPIDGIAATIHAVHTNREAGEASLEAMRLLRDQLRSHGAAMLSVRAHLSRHGSALAITSFSSITRTASRSGWLAASRAVKRSGMPPIWRLRIGGAGARTGLRPTRLGRGRGGTADRAGKGRERKPQKWKIDVVLGADRIRVRE